MAEEPDREVDLFVVSPTRTLVTPAYLPQVGEVEEAKFAHELANDFHVEGLFPEAQRALSSERYLEHLFVEFLEDAPDSVLTCELGD
mmetsp:Transcript_45186/g.59936  ORF Transcript_45186/g.59936 Transcript_45186/m.59936 type:complete len:87 (-) Transcript_45186:2230-2490(-)